VEEISQNDSSVVKLAFDLKSNLVAIKTPLNSKCTKMIEREDVILKTLNHPLIVEIQGEIAGQISGIVTKFAGNRSLANHLESTEYRLRGGNKITKVIVGIALAMRFVHSKGVIHGDLKTDNILLDWDWKVRITHFGQSDSPDLPSFPVIWHPNVTIADAFRKVTFSHLG
jgi:serine/threonine protein kinase